MKLTLRFEFYSEEELTRMLVQRSRALNWDVEEIIFPLIAQRSRGTPRLALRLLQSCRRSAVPKGKIRSRKRILNGLASLSRSMNWGSAFKNGNIFLS